MCEASSAEGRLKERWRFEEVSSAGGALKEYGGSSVGGLLKVSSAGGALKVGMCEVLSAGGTLKVCVRHRALEARWRNAGGMRSYRALEAR